MIAKTWWKESVIYQVYPRSFCDSNGDGIGDLNGINSKLEYLQELGVDIIWLSPIYKSPNDDNGYDISDYRMIMDEFGTIDDFQYLLERVHSLGMKLIMDLVVNHTSDEHEWFMEAKKSKDNLYRDYYIWKEGKNGDTPNNWQSFFSIPAWSKTEETDEFYLHYFTKKQPDLNWDNEKVRIEVYEMMKWWLEMGIDGFRMDVINLIGKPEGLPDGVDVLSNGKSFAMDLYANQKNTHKYLKEMNQRVLSKYDIMTVGETPGVSPEQAMEFVDAEQNKVNMLFQFEHMGVAKNAETWEVFDYKFSEFKKVLAKWQTKISDRGWNSNYLNNHDQPRQVSMFGNDKEYRVESAKMLATMIHLQKGTPFIYQGEELGMTNILLENIKQSNDVRSIQYYEECMKNHMEEAEVLKTINHIGRDNARTPMQWNDESNAGFTTGIPWMIVNPNYKEINAKAEVEDKDSVYHYYKELIKLRHTDEVVVYGDFEHYFEEREDVFVFTRSIDKDTRYVLLNVTDKITSVEHVMLEKSEKVLGSYRNMEKSGGKVVLRPYEALILKQVG